MTFGNVEGDLDKMKGMKIIDTWRIIPVDVSG